MIKLKIEGMTCEHCVINVKSAIAEVPGVTGPVEVSLAKGQALVSGEADPKQLVEALLMEGFKAEVEA
jgi:copper chaperone